MKNLLVLLAFTLSLAAFAHPTTPTGIVLDAPWKLSLNEFAVKNVVHQSWGYSHAERNYQTTKKIALREQLTVDEDVLLASAFLHDLGGLPGFEVEGVDHGVRSAELAEPLLRDWGFPAEKIELVKEVIVGHIYYGPKPTSALAQAFRDADMLDFMGTMGVARLLAATLEMGAYPSIKNSVAVINSMMKKLPNEFSYVSSQVEGHELAEEAQKFLDQLFKESLSGKAY